MARLGDGEFNCRDGYVRPGPDMKLQQLAIVHLIDVMAAKDNHIVRILAFDRVDVLVDRIRRSLIPLFRRTKLWRNREDELPSLIGKDIPAEADMTIERIGLVLREDADSFQV